MADPSSSKRRKFEIYPRNSLQSFPTDLLMLIFGKVAVDSIGDLANIKLTCKEFQRLAGDDYVYKHVSLDKFSLGSLEWITKRKPFLHEVSLIDDVDDREQTKISATDMYLNTQKIYNLKRQALFLKRCRESGNPEVLYRDGVVIYFRQTSSSDMHELAVRYIQQATREGHEGAMYIYCMILMCGSDENDRAEGFKIFTLLDDSKRLQQCRERVRGFIRSLWRRKEFVSGPIPPSICKVVHPDETAEDELTLWESDEFTSPNLKIAFSNVKKYVNPTKEEWRIKVRVIRLWKVPNFQRRDFDDNVEMILLDEQGGRIHAIVKGSLPIQKKFTEGDLYFIRNFGVGLNSDLFRPTRHDYRLSFNLRTDVKSTVDDNFPVNGFKFVDFDVIEKESSSSPYLVDVIGLLSGIGEVCEHVVSGRKAKMVVLELDNLRGHKIECTLWEQYVDEVQTFLADHQSPQIVIIVQFARIKGFRGKNGISNTKYTTRLLMDSNVPEVIEFKKRLSSDPIESSQRLTQLSSQSSYSFENDFLKETERKSISDIKNCREIVTCITYGTIKTIENKYNWWYKSCKRCPYAVLKDFEKWYCKNCDKHWADYYPRFCVEVRVVDNTDSASFLLFDRDCVSLIGMTAADLRELHFKRGSDLEQYPVELDVLNEKSMLFKVSLKKNNLDSDHEPKYQISRVCSNETIIASFLNSAVDENDEQMFDGACEKVFGSPISQTTACQDVESQTCDSTDMGDVSLSVLTPSLNENDAAEDDFMCSVVRPSKKIKVEK